MEWSCFIVLDNPEIVDVLNQQSIQNHYKTDLPALRGLKYVSPSAPWCIPRTQMPYKNAYSTVVGGLRVYVLKRKKSRLDTPHSIDTFANTLSPISLLQWKSIRWLNNTLSIQSKTTPFLHRYYAYLEGKEFFDHLRYKQSFVNSKDIKLWC